MNNPTENMQLSNKEYKTYFEKGISYEQYLKNMTFEIEFKSETKSAGNIPLNLVRSRRIAKTFNILDNLKNEIIKIPQRIYWLVISEHWCGDSSQIVPALNEIAKASDGKIYLRIIYRDENPELMNAHLTAGSRSIPKLIQFDEKFNFTGEFGPRPDEGQKLVMDLRSDPLTANKYNEILHKWYADDKSVSIQNDILNMIKNAESFIPAEV